MTMQTAFFRLSFAKNKNPFSRSRERLSGIFVKNGKNKKQKKTKKHL